MANINPDKTWHELISGRIYLGAASDVPGMVAEDGVSVIIDLRAESSGCAVPTGQLDWQQIPLGDEATDAQAPLFAKAIQAVVSAYRQGRKVGFHCGGGKGRTGTVAVGVLMELGLAATLAEAESMAKAIRPVISLKPEQRQALQTLYPQG
ncbi:protein-tyrosine phosphatase family protein [Leeia oryzae]|uniref:protein-tyrosine phosphatase family protein n=1 Tax=Leeia oryzae TaxID=356662 RepID=UPI00035DA8CF|nr:dual specificity protein phosphatase family protein [Leeia oryzae]